MNIGINETMNFIKQHKNGISIDIYVSPKSAKTQIKGERENRLWISLTSAPEDNKANKELIKFLAKLLDIAPSQITIESGLTGRRKRILINSVPKRLGGLSSMS